MSAASIAVLSAAKRWRTNFPNHERLAPDSATAPSGGMPETVELAAEDALALTDDRLHTPYPEQLAPPNTQNRAQCGWLSAIGCTASASAGPRSKPLS